jgi:tetratricopeptide (TPR) repeat protein
LLIAATPTWAQATWPQSVRDDLALCDSKDADEMVIDGCTAFLQSGADISAEYLLAAYFARGNAYYSSGDYDRAIPDFTEAIGLNPKHDDLANLYSARGLAYYSKKRYSEAIADYTQTIALTPRYADAYKLRALAYYMNGQPNDAIADYRTELQLDPDAQGVKEALKFLGATP